MDDADRMMPIGICCVRRTCSSGSSGKYHQSGTISGVPCAVALAASSITYGFRLVLSWMLFVMLRSASSPPATSTAPGCISAGTGDQFQFQSESVAGSQLHGSFAGLDP